VSTALFDLAPVPKWAGSRALVPVDRDACPSCAGLITTVTVAEVPLFRHGGYGAVRQTTSRICAGSLTRASRCRWGLTVDVTEVNPRGFVR
jgi:hypothetical protein